MEISLSDINRMNVVFPCGKVYTGGSQEWYGDRWRRVSGCGPTAAANLVWYAAAERLSNAYGEIQNEMFDFVTPGVQGVNSSRIFTEGIRGYGVSRGLDIVPRVMEIPQKPRVRPDAGEALRFLTGALKADSPVAFLNLSNGTLVNLDNWHWVTITEIETESLAATVFDQGKAFEIDFAEWLETSILGGSLVYINIK